MVAMVKKQEEDEEEMGDGGIKREERRGRVQQEEEQQVPCETPNELHQLYDSQSYRAPKLQSLDREPSPFLTSLRALMVRFQGFGGGDPSTSSALTSSKHPGILDWEISRETCMHPQAPFSFINIIRFSNELESQMIFTF